MELTKLPGNKSIALFSILGLISVYLIFQLKFSFDFEQFFPTNDPDLEFFKEFIEEFETDDNFLFIAVEKKSGVFEQEFLEKFHDLTLATRTLPYVVSTQSLTKISYPVKTPFAITTIPAIHINDPSKYERDKEKILTDERFVYNLISKDGTALNIVLKTTEKMKLEESEELMDSLNLLMAIYDFEAYHFLGRAYFQQELVYMQKREIIVSGIVSMILVLLIMFLIFRRPKGIAIALVSIGLGLLLFLGLLGLLGRELNAMAALYPVLMIIVGTSDVIHIMSKYIDELRKGLTNREAITITIKEIGLATLLTSATTAVGFGTLMTSQVQPIRDFGINAAIGVLVAYVTVIFFTTALLVKCDVNDLVKIKDGKSFWNDKMRALHKYTTRNGRAIALGALGFAIFALIGISKISTNYNIIDNMPRGEKITEDFLFFENMFAGFRPMEFAVFAKNGKQADDYEVLKEIDKLEIKLRTSPHINSINSILMVYKSINQMMSNNRKSAYEFPNTEKQFNKVNKFAEKVPEVSVDVLLSQDKTKTRIACRMKDIGADSTQLIRRNLDTWIASNIDTSVIALQQTGTGLILEKNSIYVRQSLLWGLGLAVLIVGLIMALLFRDWRLMVISLIPNVIPLILAGALLGYLGVELEAGISIVFAVIFGIAVDDTIHFISKFMLARRKGLNIDDSLEITFVESGKAIILTSIILFFGFLVLLFSIHPPSVVIGLLISATLLSAVIGDLLLIPVLIRWLIKEENSTK